MKKLLIVVIMLMMFSMGCSAATNITATTSLNGCGSGNCPMVTIKWTDTTIGPLTYSVLRSPISGGPYTTIATGLTGNTYIDKSVKRGSIWYYVMTATNMWGTSGYSNEIKALP